ncbi:hypothetical protein [Bacillus sp. 37MA]|uniref:hypothetical protein n=1 Tax=Bacillus sp. 37MA TaxID=1132442 RepID=UPI00036F9DB7|nr:hypothetical protein [Bacillus sp. 37MA]
MTKIEYEVSVKEYVGLWFEKTFIVEFESDVIERTEILHLPVVPQDLGRFNMIFYLKPFYNRDTLWDQIDEHLGEILDYLAFEYGLSIERVQRLDEFCKSFIFAGTCDFTKDQIRKMEAELKQQQYDPYRRLYRIALQNEDPVARFVLLYNILLEKLGAGQEGKEEQKAVDEFIRVHCKETYKVEEDMLSYEEKRVETIYTWLKNQIGHTKTNREMEEVKSKIQEKLSELCLIVQTAIRHDEIVQ